MGITLLALNVLLFKGRSLDEREGPWCWLFVLLPLNPSFVVPVLHHDLPTHVHVHTPAKSHVAGASDRHVTTAAHNSEAPEVITGL